MASLIALVVLFILSKSNSKVLAYPSGPYISANRICASLTIPVTVDHARNTIYRVLPVNNDADAVEYSLDLDNASAPVRNISQFNIVNETFDISVQLCTPKVTVGDKAKALQIATHGLYFDKRYFRILLKVLAVPDLSNQVLGLHPITLNILLRRIRA